MKQTLLDSFKGEEPLLYLRYLLHLDRWIPSNMFGTMHVFFVVLAFGPCNSDFVVPSPSQESDFVHLLSEENPRTFARPLAHRDTLSVPWVGVHR